VSPKNQALCQNNSDKNWKMIGGLGQAKRNLGTSHLKTQYTRYMPTGFANSVFFWFIRASFFMTRKLIFIIRNQDRAMEDYSEA